MKNSHTSKIFIALALFIFVNSATVSAKIPGLLQRTHLGYSVLFNQAEFKVRQAIITPDFVKDTNYKYNMNTSGSFGFTIGTYVPISRLGEKSILAFGVDYMYNMMLWDTKLKTYDYAGNYYDAPFSGGTLQMALPVGLDFKFGADAMTDKAIRFCATLGAGALPSYSLTALDQVNNIDGQFGIAPYGKVELGIFAGICMKIRAVYSYGNLSYMDDTRHDEFSKTRSQLIGKSNLTLSLLVMPFSWGWSRAEWWNTF